VSRYFYQANSSDLKQFTDLQAARIQHLESLLGYQQDAPWQMDSTFDPSRPDLPLADLEVMRPSPEPETRPLGFYNPFSNDAALSAFGPSPATLSSGSVTNDFRRSASLSGSGSIGSGSPMDDEMRGRQAARPDRRESAAEIRMGMSGMDLDAMFGGIRREGDGGIRW
jgi:hypothetical protein